MKTLKLIIGIFLCILYPLMFFASCSEVIAYNTTESAAGLTAVFILLIGAITAICTRKSKKGSFINCIIFLIGYLITMPYAQQENLNNYYKNIFIILTITFLIIGIFQKSKKQDNDTN